MTAFCGALYKHHAIGNPTIIITFTSLSSIIPTWQTVQICEVITTVAPFYLGFW
jgi:hypothetical protein